MAVTNAAVRNIVLAAAVVSLTVLPAKAQKAAEATHEGLRAVADVAAVMAANGVSHGGVEAEHTAEHAADGEHAETGSVHGVEEHGTAHEHGAENEHNAEGGHGAKSGHGSHSKFGHGTHDHGGGHHVVQSELGTTTAVMLFGFVAFLMALFYLVNWHDADIRAYTWIIASATVSIFCAVLAHSAFFQTTMSLLGGKEYVWVNFVQFLILWASTQCLLLVFKDGDAVSQTVREAQLGHHEESQSLHQAGDGEAHVHTVNVPLKAFGTIMAHITGFAGIRCFLSLQVSPGFPFQTSWYMTVLVIPIFLLVSVLLVKVSRELRLRWVGDKDKEEEADMLWREQCSESEDDAVGLSLSSLTCASLRYLISGDIPQPHGAVTGRTSAQALSLYGVGLLFAVLVSVATYKLNQIKQQMLQNPGEEISHYADRMVKTFQIWAGLTMSWCFYFATQWCFFTLLEPYEKISHGCAGKLLQAVLVTFCCMLVIFVLDCVGDGSEECKKAFKGVITALGLLVGISWEGSFTLAVDEIVANYPKHALLMKNLLAFMLVLVVLPAWRLYILPKSDPKIWSYYQGRLPPLMALCKQWDPVKDYKESKTEKWRKHGFSAPVPLTTAGSGQA